MSEASDRQEVATTGNRDLATMPFHAALEAYTPNFAAELPNHIPVERFKRTIVTALNMSPDLRQADRRSLFNAAVKCAHDGLYPDGREAALVVFNSRTQNEHGQDVWIKAVQYLPMIAGIRKRMRNTGEVLSATAEVVYRNDKFRYVKGEDPHIEHEPPAIDQERGDAVGAYAIIKLANGETLREVMGKPEIERARAVSKSGQKADSPWVKWWDEMARKTVLRRCAKSAPTGSDLDRLLARDEEGPEMPALSEIREIPPRPRREDFIPAAEPDPEEQYEVVDEETGEVGEEEDALGLRPLAEPASPEGAEAAEAETVHPQSLPTVSAAPSLAVAIQKQRIGAPPDWERTRKALTGCVYNIESLDDVAAFRKLNLGTMAALREGDRERWEAVNIALADKERVLRGGEA
jgi:phage RecT family recombinase